MKVASVWNCLATMVVLALGVASTGCKRTTVLVAPHANPGQVSTGIVEHSRLGSVTINKGVVAISEVKRGDFVWRITKDQTRIEFCNYQWCVEPKPVKGTEVPDRRLTFLEADVVRPGSSRAGVWVGGGIIPYVHYCFLDSDGPKCESASRNGSAVPSFGALATHSLRVGDEVEDVLWVSTIFEITRCRRLDQHATCESTPVQ